MAKPPLCMQTGPKKSPEALVGNENPEQQRRNTYCRTSTYAKKSSINFSVQERDRQKPLRGEAIINTHGVKGIEMLKQKQRRRREDRSINAGDGAAASIIDDREIGKRHSSVQAIEKNKVMDEEIELQEQQVVQFGTEQVNGPSEPQCPQDDEVRNNQGRSRALGSENLLGLGNKPAPVRRMSRKDRQEKKLRE